MSDNKKIKSQAHANIQRLFIIRALSFFMLYMPTLVLFYRETGLSMTEVFILQGAYSISIVVFEVPSGYFADLWGKRRSIILGCTLTFLGLVCYGFSQVFSHFLVAELLVGLGVSFISGADSALLYESVKAIGKAGEYRTFEGAMMSWGNFSEGIAAVFGGLLAVVSLRMPFFIHSIFMFFSIILSLGLSETRSSRGVGGPGILKVIDELVLRDKQLLFLISFSAVVGSSTFAIVWLIQPYIKLYGLPLVFFGVFWALLQFTVGFFAMNSNKVSRLFSVRGLFILLILLPFVSNLCLSQLRTLWAAPIFFIFYIVRGVHLPTVQDLINSRCSADFRATVLSVRSLFSRLFFTLFGPLIGFVYDLRGINGAFAISAAIFGSFGFLFILLLERSGYFSDKRG